MKEIKNLINRFVKEETAIGTIEIILILVVLIGLVVIFKSSLTKLMNSIFKTITSRAGKI